MATTPSRSQRVRKYFSDISLAITSTTKGLRITGRTMFETKETVEYPEVRTYIAPGHRGIHGYDEEKCISCDMCAAACPVDCIYIKSVGKGQDSLMTQFDIDYTKCLFCDLCTPPCPTECIWMTQEYDLASYSKEDCIVNFARTKTAEEMEAHEEKLKKMDEEKKRKAAEKKAAAAAEEAGEQAASSDEAEADAGAETSAETSEEGTSSE